MNYNQNECPVCKKEFTQDDDIVVCPDCGTPHHRECWKAENKCANVALHGEGYIWQNKNSEDAPAEPAAKNEKTKLCPSCGAENGEFEPVCSYCGTRLKAFNFPNLFEDANPHFEQAQPTQNPNEFSSFGNYYAKEAESVFGKEAVVDGIAVTEIAEYIQKDNVHYIGKFIEMEKNGTKISWNNAAFFGGMFWSFYRKMTSVGVLLLCAFISVSLLASIFIPAIFTTVNPAEYDKYISTFEAMNEEMLKIYESDSSQSTAEYYRLAGELFKTAPMIASFVAQIAAILIINVIMGFFGNSFYKNKIKKDIFAIRKISGNAATYHAYLHHRGGTSMINVIMPVMLYISFELFMGFI